MEHIISAVAVGTALVPLGRYSLGGRFGRFGRAAASGPLGRFGRALVVLLGRA